MRRRVSPSSGRRRLGSTDDQLALGAVERGGEGRDLEAAREGEAEQHGDDLVAREGDRRQEIALEQAVAALGAALGIDRNAGRAQHLDIAVDGADRDLEAACEVARRDRAAVAEQQQDAEGPLDPRHLSPRCVTEAVQPNPASDA